MPTYIYKCPIHNEFEYEHPISVQLEVCPLCQQENNLNPQKVERLISAGTGFILNGGGWASSGYSSK